MKYRGGMLIVSILVAVMVLLSLVRGSIRAKKYRSNFENEMAQRLDLEEKINRIEDERKALAVELQALRRELLKNQDAVTQLNERLAGEQGKNRDLETALKKAEEGFIDTQKKYGGNAL